MEECNPSPSVQKAYDILQGIAQQAKSKGKTRKFSVIKEEETKFGSVSSSNESEEGSDSSGEVEIPAAKIRLIGNNTPNNYSSNLQGVKPNQDKETFEFEPRS